MNQHLEFLLSNVYDGPTRLDHPLHLADLRKSGLTDETIAQQRFTDVPPDAYRGLLGVTPRKVVSAFLIPFADPRGGWMDHVRMKIFPPIATKKKGTVKYLQPKGSGVRIYFPLVALPAVLHSDAPLYIIEGEKKALAVAQTGLPAIGIAGIEGWHRAGSSALHPDLDDAGLDRRVVNLIPDADVRTNPAVQHAVSRLVTALGARGVARVHIVEVPAGYKGIDDYLVANP